MRRVDDGALPSLVVDGRLRGAQFREQHIGAALGTLTAQERTAFVLRHYEGQSIEQIGAALGIGTNATKNSVFRAVQKLRRALEPFVGATQCTRT